MLAIVQSLEYLHSSSGSPSKIFGIKKKANLCKSPCIQLLMEIDDVYLPVLLESSALLGV